MFDEEEARVMAVQALYVALCRAIDGNDMGVALTALGILLTDIFRNGPPESRDDIREGAEHWLETLRDKLDEAYP